MGLAKTCTLRPQRLWNSNPGTVTSNSTLGLGILPGWYGMENSQKPGMEKNGNRNGKRPQPGRGQKWQKNGPKMDFWGRFPLFFHFWAIFCHFWPRPAWGCFPFRFPFFFPFPAFGRFPCHTSPAGSQTWKVKKGSCNGSRVPVRGIDSEGQDYRSWPDSKHSPWKWNCASMFQETAYLELRSGPPFTGVLSREENSMDQYRSRLKLSKTETFRELWAPLVHTNFGGNSYGPIIGPYLFLGKFVWTNGPESSSQVSRYTGSGPWMALPSSGARAGKCPSECFFSVSKSTLWGTRSQVPKNTEKTLRGALSGPGPWALL